MAEKTNVEDAKEKSRLKTVGAIMALSYLLEGEVYEEAKFGKRADSISVPLNLKAMEELGKNLRDEYLLRSLMHHYDSVVFMHALVTLLKHGVVKPNGNEVAAARKEGLEEIQSEHGTRLAVNSMRTLLNMPLSAKVFEAALKTGKRDQKIASIRRKDDAAARSAGMILANCNDVEFLENFLNDLDWGELMGMKDALSLDKLKAGMEDRGIGLADPEPWTTIIAVLSKHPRTPDSIIEALESHEDERIRENAKATKAARSDEKVPMGVTVKGGKVETLGPSLRDGTQKMATSTANKERTR
jgi:hypothetical protein